MIEAIDLTWIGPAGLALTLYMLGRPSLSRRRKGRAAGRRPHNEAPQPGTGKMKAGGQFHHQRSTEMPQSDEAMRISAACRTLGLNPNARATREDVQAAWKKSIKGKHPDQGGDGVEFTRIMEARVVLMEAISTYEASMI